MACSLQEAPLLPQIRTILGRMGYEALTPDATSGNQLYWKGLGVGSLSTAFYAVSGDGVQKMGMVPMEKPLSHVEFVTKHVRHLFG
jgi:hypothetical protein